MAESPYAALHAEITQRVGRIASPLIEATINKVLGGSDRAALIEAQIRAVLARVIERRIQTYLTSESLDQVILGEGGDGVATISTGKGLAGNGSPELPARIADIEQTAIERIARYMDQIAALVGKTIDISLLQGSIWAPTTDLAFALLNAAPADPSSVVESLPYVTSQTLTSPSERYAIIMKLPATEDPSRHRLVMQDSAGAVVDAVTVGSCIPIALATPNLPDTYFRIDDPFSGGMLLRDTVGEWVRIEAEKDMRTNVRSEWGGGYKDGSIDLDALDPLLQQQIGQSGVFALGLDELQTRIVIVQDQSGALILPTGRTVSDYQFMIIQVEVEQLADPTAIPPRLAQFNLQSRLVVLTAENIVAPGPHPVEFYERTVTAEEGTQRTVINDPIAIDVDLNTMTWHVPEETTSATITTYLHIWGLRSTPHSGTFQGLTDTPALYGDALSLVRTRQDQMGLEFVSLEVDRTPIDGLRLALDESTAGQLTIRLERAQAHAETRYAAASADAVFTEAEWLAGNTSMTDSVTFPNTAIQHHKGFAIPANEASLTDIRVQGSPFGSRASYLPAVGDPDVLQDIGGVSHKTYIQIAPDFADTNQNTYILR